MTKNDLRNRIAIIVGRAARRSNLAETPSLREALAFTDRLIASDDAPEWDQIRAGREQLAQVVQAYRNM